MIINLQPYLFFDKLIDVPRLTAKIIKSWLEDGVVDLRTKEGQSFEELGLYELLDSICDEFNIPKDVVSLTNDNWNEKHDQYDIQQSPFNFPLTWFNRENKSLVGYEGNKFYGLFIGRLNEPRIKALIQSRRRAIPSLASCNGDFLPYLENIKHKLIATSYCTVQEFHDSVKKHSDIGLVMKPPITPPHNSYGSHWAEVYKSIAIEIVLETTDWPGSFHLTEKTLRPIYYKRPFIIVGSRGFMQKLRDIGFKTFDGIIDNHYENFEYCVEHAFKSLDLTYANNQYGHNPKKLLEHCKDDLDHNYNLLLDMARTHHRKFLAVDGLDYHGRE